MKKKEEGTFNWYRLIPPNQDISLIEPPSPPKKKLLSYLLSILQIIQGKQDILNIAATQYRPWIPSGGPIKSDEW